MSRVSEMKGVDYSSGCVVAAVGLYAWQRMQLECRPGGIFYTDEGNIQSGQIVLFDNDRGREREKKEGTPTSG